MTDTVPILNIRTGRIENVERIEKTDREWQEFLTTNQYYITRRKGTEPPFTGSYHNFYDEGMYLCVCCGTALFDSKTKFVSGTGWPNFYAPVAEQNIKTAIDRRFGMVRTEVMCARCDSHLGHVFDDGPPPTGKRFCINSASLKFEKPGE